MTRTFEAKPARRERTPIIMGIIAPSGAGKTKSALRLADGFARVVPGPTVMIDTEAGRAKQHSDVHRFLHIDFEPPHGPLDYIAAFREALRHNPTTIIVDQVSYEWEGTGGVLEMHEAELDRMAGQDWKKRERCTMAAWIRPKAEHSEMKRFVIQQRVNWIFLFRAKEKIKPVPGKEPVDLGWQALGAEDLIYEMLLKVLIFPGGDGVPTWTSDKIGERQLMKLPGWFRDLFAKPRQLDEDIGEQLARWAVGGDVGAAREASPTATSSRAEARDVTRDIAHPFVGRFEACEASGFKALDAEMRKGWSQIPAAQRAGVTAAFERARERIRRAESIQRDTGMSADEAAEIARIEREERRT
ncbi:MAG TPA: hypothetical protein VJU58_13790 [Microbacterium sp.]|nr:hypothetical protein [Microbacterium sp.]